MFCPKCGAQVRDGASFCSGCGIRFGDEWAKDTESPLAQDSAGAAKHRGKQTKYWVAGIVAVMLVVVGVAGVVIFLPLLTPNEDGGLSDSEIVAGTANSDDQASAVIAFENSDGCAATCHSPMDPYIKSYNQVFGESGIDKWGNAVADTSSMLCLSHKDIGLDCLSCHQLAKEDKRQLSTKWVSGDYINPLQERDTEELTAARGAEPDEFCLNAACHDLTRDDLIKATSDMDFNPHVAQHTEQACSNCHKAHRASVDACTQCHSEETKVPEGWLTYDEEKMLEMP